MLSSCTILLLTNPSGILSGMMSAGSNTVTLCLSMLGIYAVWLGILEILEESGLAGKLTNLLKPVIRKLFPKASESTQKNIAVNLSSNMLGLGNAATPSGIEAMQGLEQDEKGEAKEGRASFGMSLLLVMNALSVQLFPTTIIGMRTVAGSRSPADIFLPTLLVSLTTFLLGIGICLTIRKLIKRKRSK